MKRWIALLAISMMVFAACSAPGDETTEETTADNDTSTEETTAPADRDPLVIGVLMPQTGTVAAPGADLIEGWELYFSENGTTFGGRDVEYIIEDTASNPDTAKQKATQLVEVEGAEIIIPGILANVGNAIADQVKDNPAVLSVTSSSCADDLLQRTPIDRYIRAGGWSCSQTSHVLGDWAAKNGFSNVATACSDYAFGHELCGGFVDVFTTEGGTVDPDNQLWFPLGPQDFATYATQLQDLGVDGAMILPVGASTIDWMQTWSDFGLSDELPLLAGEVVTDQSVLRNMDPDTVIGTISAGHWAEGADVQATKDFVTLFEESTGKIPSYYAAAGWSAAQWIAETLEETGGEFSPELFTDTMKTMTVDTPFGSQSLDDTGNPIFTVYIREVTEREDGKLWNTVIATYEDVDQYWPQSKEDYLAQPVYSRDFQGNNQ